MTIHRPSASRFTLTYEGAPHQQHPVAVRDLAPVVLSLNDLIERTNTLVNGSRVSTELQITAIRTGSIELAFLLIMEGTEVAIGFLSSEAVTSAANLIQLTFGGAVLVRAVGSFRRRRASADEPADDQGAAHTESLEVDIDPSSASTAGRIHVRGELTRDNMGQLIRLANDAVIRRSLEGVLDPLSRNGFERLVVRESDQPIGLIDQSDALSMSQPRADGDIVSMATTRQILRIVSPSLGSLRLKWRLSNGASTNWYSIFDDDFLERVLRGSVHFRTGDTLTCDVRTIQRILEDSRLTVEFQVLRVIEHRQRHVRPD